MSRKQFIESQGATCRNWTWSWSFINEDKKFVIFGAWDRNTEGSTTLILSDEWQIGEKGKRPGYEQSREHVRLVEEEGYALMTFPMKYSDAHKDEDGIGPAKIDGFEPVLTKRVIKRVGGNWYASDDRMSDLLPEEVDGPEQFTEGALKTVTVNTYERNPDARAKCIKHYGYVCVVCDFDFAAVYGPIGEKYIHVHHVVPLAEIGKEYVLNPIEHLRPVCPNCHAMIHRTRPAMKVEQLRKHLEERRDRTVA